MDDLLHRSTGGWPERKYCYMSQALSCLQLAQFHPDLELVTDTIGKQLLLEKLDLPYKKVSVALDIPPHYPGDLWSAKNLYTYSIQQSPFIHVDGDVYITHSLESSDSETRIWVENQLRIQSRPLQAILDQIIPKLADKPGYLHPPNTPYIEIWNAGIFGGNDLAFIQAFSRDALKTVENNLSLITDNLGIEIGDLNHGEFRLIDLFSILFYSYLFTAFTAREAQVPLTMLEPLDIEMLGDSHISMISPDLSHIHPIYNEKRRSVVCSRLENCLRCRYPKYYYHIKSLLTDYKI